MYDDLPFTMRDVVELLHVKPACKKRMEPGIATASFAAQKRR